jgi:hypothetical protein
MINCYTFFKPKHFHFVIPLVKIENLAEIKDDELQSTLEEIDSAEFHLAASDLYEDIITHF